MGLLFDSKFWADAYNDMRYHKPTLGEPSDAVSVKVIRRVACNAFTALLEDQALKTDIEKAKLLAQLGMNIDGPKMNAFLEEFMEIEHRVLEEAGVDKVARIDLINELRAIAGGKTSGADRFDRLQEKIAFCRRLACEPSAGKRDLADRVWKATQGVVLVSADVGVTGSAGAIFGPGGGVGALLVVGTSVSYGVEFVNKAIKGMW